MNGYFSAHMLERYAELLAEQNSVEFSEDGETYDFTRCVRPDGSAYAIASGKKCRQGTEQAADVVAPKAKKAKKEKAPAAPKAPAAKKPAAKGATAAAAAPKAEKAAASPAPKGPQSKAQKLKELASKLKDDVLAKLTKNPKAPPELQKAAQAEIAKRAGKPEAAPKAVKKEPPAKALPKKPAKPAAKGGATEAEISAQKKLVADLIKKANNAKSSSEEEKAYNQYKKEKAKLDKMTGKNPLPKIGGKPAEPATALAAAANVKKLEEKAKAANEAYQKALAAGDAKAAAAAYKKGMKISEQLDKAKGVSARLKAAAEKRQQEAEAKDATQKKINDRQREANLTPAQKKAIANYTAEGAKFGYDKMNTCLRTPPSCPDPAEAKKVNKEFDAALKALPKNTDGDTFYRGIGVQNTGPTAALYDLLEKAQPGQKFKDPAYGSYSADDKQAAGFQYGSSGRSILFVSRNKNLTPINMFSEIPTEQEAVLPRGTEQTIRSVRQDGNMLVVELD